jgi:hypothetical protein
MGGQDLSEYGCISVEHSRNLNQAETECAQLYNPGSSHDLIGVVCSPTGGGARRPEQSALLVES